MTILFQQFENHFVFTHLRCNTTASFVNELKFIFWEWDMIWMFGAHSIQMNSNWMNVHNFFLSFLVLCLPLTRLIIIIHLKNGKKTCLWCVCYSICSFAKDFLLTVVSLLNFSCHIQFSCLLFFIRFSIGISNFTFSQLNELKVCRYQTF